MVSWDRVGERLRRALAEKDVERGDLARSTRIAPSDLAALEQGRSAAVSTAALARLARRLDLPPTALWSDDPSAELELSLHFRHASVPDFFHEDEAAARGAVLTAHALAELETLLGRDPLRTWFRPKPVGTPPHEDGYARAREVRRVLAGKGALPSEDAPLPAPLEDLIEDALGIPVIEAKLTTANVLALTAKDGPTGAVAIVINSSAMWGESPVRRRVDECHELAHALFDETAQPLSVWIDREQEADDSPENKRLADPVEQRARAFAAELLLPRTGLRELLGPPAPQASVERAIDLAKRAQERFLSSAELTAYHLANHGYFAGYFHDDVVRALAGPTMTPALPRIPVLERRARQAVEAGLLTAMGAREILGLPVWADLPWADA